MKLIYKLSVAMLSVLVGFVCSMACTMLCLAGIISVRSIYEGDLLKEPGYVNLGDGFLMILVGLPLLLIFMFVFTTSCYTCVSTYALNIRRDE